MKYRIVERKGKYYAHAKINNFLIPWRKIAKHPDGYGLYFLPDWDYGKDTIEEAKTLIDDFHNWYSSEKEATPKYYEYKLS